jgi:hypothetical protein
MHRRRSERILVQSPVVVEGRTLGENRFTERTRAAVISAHGALLSLASAVALGQTLALGISATGARQECCVVYLGDQQGGRTEVGVEFTVAAPQFWDLPVPPENWKPYFPKPKASSVRGSE